ncbi:BatA domain-containing protein [Aestuariibaculum suncheonense]|uniref:BatA domain-containing protein n=1 Tax=Aestuariibaculum suncheonense TaxID=1028745 RepID=A0A8J6UB28_9FLAO|nr:BatA domain-containing protein [Aestuariibaculum suncheonense]MBD0835933.1 BatA domain-containing protein [Aestuariibaculum suncheonense]
MQFKHPELLYALFLLLIPIIIHLFQLRKFQKVEFTNVAFLKRVTIETRKSSQIKKWLVLFARLLLLACIVLAFAQPFTSNYDNFNTKKETVIYLDNSFSMQAKGNNGELLKRAVQDVISNVPEDETVSILTNNNTFRNTNIKAVKNDLLQLDYTANNLTLDAALLKSKTLFSKQKGILKHLVFVSDYQRSESAFTPETDSLTTIHLVKLNPVNGNNVAIDSAYISESSATTIILKVLLTNSGETIENLPVSLFNDDKLIAKTSVSLEDIAETTFSLPANEIINGKITIDDASLQFDNTLYFNINDTSKIKVLCINASDDDFLKRIYTEDEFIYSSVLEKQLNYNDIEQQQLIVLNELKDIPNALVAALKSFTNQGGSLLIIPSDEANINSYNALLGNYGSSFHSVTKAEKRITTISYAHPLYNSGVFEKQVNNFQYPKTESFYDISSNNASSVLQFEDSKPFLYQNKTAYVFTSALNKDISNFKSSPLIVPTLYNIGKFSLQLPKLYYTIGKDNTFDVATTLQQDAILSLVKDDINIIPKQQYFNSKVAISTSETPDIAHIYRVMNKKETLKKVSYNYDRSESNLTYMTLASAKHITISNSITEIFDSIKSDTKVNALWKWFVIFALAFLIIEMGILKYFK